MTGQISIQNVKKEFVNQDPTQENVVARNGFTLDIEPGMSDRVVVMASRPSKVEAVININLPRPRARAQDTFQVYRSKILDILNLGGHIGDIEYVI